MRAELRILNFILSRTIKRNFLNGINIKRLRRSDLSFDSCRSGKNLLLERISAAGVDVLKIAPESKDISKVIIYLHGGAYVSGPAGNHISFLRRLSLASASEILLVRYALAPEKNCMKAHSDVQAVYDFALAEYPGKEIILAGDSAGGGLALAFTMALRDSGGLLPSKLVLLSPWLDASLSNSKISPEADRADPILGRSGLLEAGRMFADNLPLDNFLVSPFYGDPDGLPPMLILSSNIDILVHDCRDFYRRCRDSGLEIIYSEYSDIFHAWIVMPPSVQEVKQAFSEVARYISA